MAKIILLVLVVAALFWFFSGRYQKRSATNVKPSASAENMVICAHCRLCVPESESVPADGRYYCCDEHRKLGAS